MTEGKDAKPGALHYAGEGPLVIALRGVFSVEDNPDTYVLLRKLPEFNADIVLDLSEMIFIDSAGLGCLVGILKGQNENKRKLTLRNVAHNIQTVLDITGLARIIAQEWV